VSSHPGPRYLTTEHEWDRLVAAVRYHGRMGWDTETYGHDVRKSSPVMRAKIHIWSVALLGRQVHPRGYRLAQSRVLPAAALEYPPLRRLMEDPAVVKPAHNLPHDVHSMWNHGIKVAGGVDTLPRARIALPWEEAWDLKSLGERVLARDVITWEDLVTEPNPVEIVHKFSRKVCACGVLGCKLKKARGPVTHEKTVETWETRETAIRGTRQIPLETIVPGHYRWDLALQYSGQDAEMVIELEDALNKMEAAGHAEGPPVPWA